MIKSIILKLLRRKPIKVVIAKDGYFKLSNVAWERLITLGCTIHRCVIDGNIIKNNPDIVDLSSKEETRYVFRVNFPRNDKRLLQIVEELGDAATVNGCKLKIVTLPLDIKKWYVVEEDLGGEYICEDHRIFY